MAQIVITVKAATTEEGKVILTGADGVRYQVPGSPNVTVGKSYTANAAPADLAQAGENPVPITDLQGPIRITPDEQRPAGTTEGRR